MIADKNESDQEAGRLLSQRISARRRLLRGTFAVPTVLALSSGSALAATSSMCYAKLPAGVDSPPDNYFRVQRYQVMLGETMVKLVKGSEISSLAAVNGFLVGDYGGTVTTERWIRVDNGTVVTLPAGTVPAADGFFVSLRLTHTGGTEASPVFTVTGLASSSQVLTGSGKVMTHSCWASI